MKLLRSQIPLRFLLIFSVFIFFNVDEVRSDECGCVICQPWSDLTNEYPIPNITLDEYRKGLGGDAMCSNSQPHYCPTEYSCVGFWNNVVLNTCPPNNNCRGDYQKSDKKVS